MLSRTLATTVHAAGTPDAVQEASEGRFAGGVHVYGLENDGVGYALDDYNRQLVPSAVIDRVEAARRKIVAGEIAVTDATEP